MPNHITQRRPNESAAAYVARLASKFLTGDGQTAATVDHAAHTPHASAAPAASEGAESRGAALSRVVADSSAPAASSRSAASSTPAASIDGPSAAECERRELARVRDREWTRRASNAPQPIGSLVAARALEPGMLSPTTPEKLHELAARYEVDESADGIGNQVMCARVEPFAEVPRAPAPPLSARERKRNRSVEARYTEHATRLDAATRRWAAWWRELGESTEHLPPTADPETFAIGRAIVCSREAADAALRMIGINWGGNVLDRVQASAFGPRAAPRWDTRHLCARRSIALAVWALRDSRLKYTGHRDRYGRPIFQPCIWGTGRGYLQALLADPATLKPLSVERLTHSDDASRGLFHKAEDARVFVRQSKIPSDVVERDEIGPSGYTFNRYWVSRHFNAKAALRLELGNVSTQEASDRAWAWLDAGGARAALRGRFLGNADRALSSVDQKWLEREAPA